MFDEPLFATADGEICYRPRLAGLVARGTIPSFNLELPSHLFFGPLSRCQRGQQESKEARQYAAPRGLIPEKIGCPLDNTALSGGERAASPTTSRRDVAVSGRPLLLCSAMPLSSQSGAHSSRCQCVTEDGRIGRALGCAAPPPSQQGEGCSKSNQRLSDDEHVHLRRTMTLARSESWFRVCG